VTRSLGVLEIVELMVGLQADFDEARRLLKDLIKVKDDLRRQAVAFADCEAILVVRRNALRARTTQCEVSLVGTGICSGETMLYHQQSANSIMNATLIDASPSLVQGELTDQFQR
jgi:hypothetical protein